MEFFFEEVEVLIHRIEGVEYFKKKVEKISNLNIW